MCGCVCVCVRARVCVCAATMKTTVKMLMDHNPHLYEAKDGKWGRGGGKGFREVFVFKERRKTLGRGALWFSGGLLN